MQTATLSTLPPEVLDLIFSFVEEHGSTAVNRKTFLSLTLVSRNILPTARRFSYAHPLFGIPAGWTRAINLLRALKANGSALGRLVRSLEGLSSWMDLLEKQEPETKSLSFQVRGQTKAFSWGLAMLEACPRLVGLGLSLKNATQVTKLHRALSPSFGTLKKVKLLNSTPRPLTAELVHKLVAKLEVDELERFEVINPDDQESATSAEPLLAFKVQIVELYLPMKPFPATTQLLPVDLSSLRSLTLHTAAYSTSDLLALVKLVGPHLHKLVLRPPYANYSLRYSTYGQDFSGPTAPLEIFSLLPQIRHLELPHARAFSVARIQALVHASPHLVTLFCRESTWVSDGASLDTISGWQSRLFPQAQLAALFSTFPCLKDLDLGIIPVLPEHPTSTLTRPLKERGVEVVFWTCRHRCESCGDYH
ncbi:hypothetical protein JCM6882_003973 [Rhodosporidiobolus microsporus]